MGTAGSRAMIALATTLALLVTSSLTAGDARAASRTLRPGALDPGFGQRGVVSTDVPGPRDDAAADVVVQPDGKFLVAGASEGAYTSAIAVARFDTSGRPDPSFGTGGVVVVPAARTSLATSLALMSDGRIVVGGFSSDRRSLDEPPNNRPVLVRLEPDGALDPTFGDRGVLLLELGPIRSGWVEAVVAREDGAIVIAGPGSDGKGAGAYAARIHSDGRLDRSFGDGGVTVIPKQLDFDEPDAAAIARDGAILILGFGYQDAGLDLSVVRLSASGAVDRSFGEGGAAVVDFGRTSDTGYDIAVQPDNKIVVAGRSGVTDGAFALARFDAAGLLDVSFGDGGRVVTTVGAHAGANGVLVLGDGRIVAAGYTREAPGVSDAVVVRYLPDGRLDASFGAGGVVRFDYGGGEDSAGPLALDATGTLVVAGSFETGAQAELGLVRLDETGALDRSFGDRGFALAGSVGAGFDVAASAARQPDGKLVVGGTTTSGETPAFALARYEPNGALDGTFGREGRVRTVVGAGPHSNLSDVAVRPDGRILAAGVAGEWERSAPIVVRYTADGRLDESFGEGGRAIVEIDAPWCETRGMAFTRDGGVLVAAAVPGVGSDVMIARLDEVGRLDEDFGSRGSVRLDLGQDERPGGLAVDSNGRIVLAGTRASFDGGTREVFVARFAADGAADASFGTGGLVLASPTGAGASASALAVQSDGRLVVGGSVAWNTGGSDSALVRFEESGALDLEYGRGGFAVADFGPQDGVVGIAIDTEGNATVAVAETIGNAGRPVPIARFTARGKLDRIFRVTRAALARLGSYEIGFASAAVVESNGAIVLAASGPAAAGGRDFVVARFAGVRGQR